MARPAVAGLYRFFCRDWPRHKVTRRSDNAPAMWVVLVWAEAAVPLPKLASSNFRRADYSMLTQPPLLSAIVAIDDNPDDLEFVRRLLIRAGLRNPIKGFHCGRTALDHLCAVAASADNLQLPCGVILDGNMPALDGFEVLRTLRSWPSYAQVKIIMVSGSNRTEDRTRAMYDGADAYFVKFPTPGEIAGVLGISEAQG